MQILSTMLDPLLQSCALSASRLNSIDMATYIVNCLYHTQSTLSVFEFTDFKIEMLAGQVNIKICFYFSLQRHLC